MPLDPVALRAPGALLETDPNVTPRPALNVSKPGVIVEINCLTLVPMELGRYQ